MLPHRGGGERAVVHQVPEPGREMDAHVAAVRARPSVLRRPASGPFVLKSLRPARCSETAPSLSTAACPRAPGHCSVVSALCRLRLVEAYRGLTAGGALTAPPTPGLGLSLQDDLSYLRSSSVAAMSEAWLRSNLLGRLQLRGGRVWGLRLWPEAPQRTCCSGAPDLCSEEAEPCLTAGPEG